MIFYDKWYDMYLLADISSTVHITHKQYTEKHNETQYLERNIHNNKNDNIQNYTETYKTYT